jgi:hypothetical protein
MSIVLEDSNLNVAEQVNVLFKSSLGFPSTKESTPWFQETSVKYNNYVNGEEILLDEIPSNPSFSVTPNLVDVNVSSSQLATGGYIKEDSTRVIRQYHRLILTPVPNSSNNSYYALDSEGNNILTDGLQFNTKWSGSGNKIYPYTLYTQAFINADSNAPNELGQDSTGGNWLYDLKNGVIFFPDYSSSLCNGTTNKPVFSFYKYIGRKGIVKQIDFKNSLLDIPNTTKKYDKQIVVQTSDNTIHRYDSSTSSWIPIGGSGGGVWEESSSNSDIFYNSSGNVGIGTDNPQAKLHIAHAEGVSEDIISLRAEGTIRTYAPDADSHIRSEITSHHQGGKLLLYDGYQPTSTNPSNTNEIQVQLSAKINEYNYINNGGRVGIGITVPQAVLHVAQKNAVWDATSNPDPVTLRVEGGILVTDVDADIHHRIKIESDGQILIYGGYSPNETANVKISGNANENNDGKTYFNAGNVGIGTTSPSNTLTINGSYNDTEPILGLRSGNQNTVFNNGAQIAFGYNGTAQYQHFIHTRHNAGNSDNAIDFYVCNGTQNNNVTSGSIHTMSLVSGRVGIGTTSPHALLEIMGEWDDANVIDETNGGIHFSTKYPASANNSTTWGVGYIGGYIKANNGSNSGYPGGLVFKTRRPTNPGTAAHDLTTSMVIDANGNVGIGTASPDKTLHLYNSSRVDIKFDTGDEDHYIRKVGNYLRFRGHDDSTILFELQNNNSVTNNDKPSNNICCFPSGCVGIGTDTPKARLEVRPTAFSTDSTPIADENGYSLSVYGKDGQNKRRYVSIGHYNRTQYLTLGYEGLFHDGTNGPLLLYNIPNDSSGYLALGTANTERMRIDYQGNVGIGTTSPVSKLEVFGEARFTTYTHTSHVGFATNGDIYNVGIGTASPGYKLDVKGDMRVYNQYHSGLYSGAEYYQSIIYLGGNSYSPQIKAKRRSGYSDKTDLEFWVSGINVAARHAMTIKGHDGYGNVGIGTTSPNQKLHVSGTARITGGLYVEGVVPDYNNIWSQHAYIQDKDGHHMQHFGASDQWRVGMKVTYSIWCLGVIGVSSDERIKENIAEIDDSYSLQKVRDISCVWYNYKDKLSRGNGKVVGFIAQQVKEHLPEAVSIQNGVIPNEMRNLEDISWNGTDMSCDLSDVSGVKYRFYVSNDLSGNDEEMKEIVGNEDNTFTFDASYNNVFCYGREVDDFNILDKQKLFALNFSATQEIDRIQQQQLIDISGNTLGIESNKNELELLKLENQELTNKVTALETELNNLKTIVESLVNNN